MIRVLLADDHAIVIEGLRALLDGEPDIKVAAWTTDGTEVVRLVEQHKPDVVVLDLELTSIKGTEVIAALRDRTTPPKVLVQHLFSKLGVKNRTEAALKYAHGR